MTSRMLLALVLIGCGGSRQDPSTMSTPEEPPDAVTVSPLVGRWTGEMAGGPISATAEYRFAADGTYTMTGYPSIGESGRYTTEPAESGGLTLHLRGRMRCGPCESAGPNEPADDSDETATLSPDGRTLSWRRWTLSRATE